MEIPNLELVKRLYKAEIISDTGSKMDLVQTGALQLRHLVQTLYEHELLCIQRRHLHGYIL